MAYKPGDVILHSCSVACLGDCLRSLQGPDKIPGSVLLA